MTAWHRGPLIAVDTETTCADPNAARIVTATAIHIKPDKPPRVHEWLARPDVPISPGATAVHGISDDRAQAEGRPTGVILAELLAVVGLAMRRGAALVAFNAAFDCTVIERECSRNGVDGLTARLDGGIAPVVDPHVIDKTVDKYRKGKRTLEATAAHYGIRLTGAHDASADALAAARLAYRLAETYPDQLQVPLEQLHAQQVAWRAEQCASLADYFMRQGKPADVNGEWPVQSLPADWDPQWHPIEKSEVA